jgi:hypothetical protein
MIEFLIEESEKTPRIHLGKGFFLIRGRSIIKNPKKFYEPVEDRIIEYLMNPPPITEVTIETEYCNAASKNCIFDILKIMAEYQNEENNAEIIFNWCYECGDEEILVFGESLASKLKVIFNYKEIS